jgi:hypothetical protein
MEFNDIRDTITVALRNKGWKKIDFSVKFSSSSGTIDIVAHSTGLRKKVLLIAIGANPFDAGIAGLLLSGVSEKGEKIIFLQEGSPVEVQSPPGIHVISKIDELPVP